MFWHDWNPVVLCRFLAENIVFTTFAQCVVVRMSPRSSLLLISPHQGYNIKIIYLVGFRSYIALRHQILFTLLHHLRDSLVMTTVWAMRVTKSCSWNCPLILQEGEVLIVS